MMKRKLSLTLTGVIITSLLLAAQPKYRYLQQITTPTDTRTCELRGSARMVKTEGREGLNLTSVHSAFEMKQHTLNENEGSVSMWVMSLEDLAPYPIQEGMSMGSPYFRNYPFLTDSPDPMNGDAGNFKILFWNNFHPAIRVQFDKGSFYEEAFDYPHQALISVSHFTFPAHRWYHFTLTWNHAEERYALYVNGILIGRENQFGHDLKRRSTTGNSVFVGGPMLCFSDYRFYDQELTEKTIYKEYREQATNYDPDEEHELLYTYAGKFKKPFSFEVDTSWTPELDLSLQSPSQMDNFYIQGEPVKAEITSEGLLLQTIDAEYTSPLRRKQMYLWTNKMFEGDLYVEYEFKVLRPGGLSLLILQATGMNREDFMADYPRKTSGMMTTVFGENVRNYHWEYYREMSDMSNDRENSVLFKNPYYRPLSFSAREKSLDYDKWHKLQFLQIGNKLVGAIDGVIMVEFEEDGMVNSGPVLTSGHIAIRCMVHTKMLFRNLKVYNRSQFEMVRELRANK